MGFWQLFEKAESGIQVAVGVIQSIKETAEAKRARLYAFMESIWRPRATNPRPRESLASHKVQNFLLCR